ncbi:MAG: DNA (cytosine-5-)-methyltransferase [Rikenellaceae bacterium]|jgi:DNA (cytosine-5)-methyltransferase 1|nr:DNA (cytosine-5-)-methyltransferase [Rikenellaceae bacterium]
MESSYVGDQIRALRNEAGLTLQSVADRLAVDVSLLSKIERSERRATKSQILQLSELFGVNKNKLLIPYIGEKISDEIVEEQHASEILDASREILRKKSLQNDRLNVIDLFSGCGGFSYGFESAGYNVVLGVDNEKIALDTFKLNHNNSKILLADLHLDSTIDEITSEVRGKTIDVIIAGPPCQGFSLTGTRRKSDNRNKLFYSIFKLAERIKPKAIIIENVPGLATLYNGTAKNEIIKQFKRLGYSCNSQVLYAPEYEVPQIRKRIFFVGLQKDRGTFEFPEPVLAEKEYNSCSGAISDLPSRESGLGNEQDSYESPALTEYQKRMRADTKILSNHTATKHTEHVTSVISLVPEGGNHKDLPAGVGDSRQFNEAWTRYHSQKPSKTIDTGHRNHFHYKYNRIPTVRENARLQSFPDSFVFLGTRTQQYRQVGNAVPPLLGYHVARQLLKYIPKSDK